MTSTDTFQIAARRLMGPTQRKWWENFDRLRTFGEEHGHFDIPPGPLRNTASNIRQKWVRGTLESEKIAALNAIKFPKTKDRNMAGRFGAPVPKDVVRLERLEKASKDGSLSDEQGKEERALRDKFRTSYSAGTLSKVYAKRFGFG